MADKTHREVAEAITATAFGGAPTPTSLMNRIEAALIEAHERGRLMGVAHALEVIQKWDSASKAGRKRND